VFAVVPVAEYLIRRAVMRPRLLLVGSSNGGIAVDARLVREASRRFDVVGVLGESDLDAGTVTELAHTQRVHIVAIAAGLPTRELARSPVSVVDLAAFLETHCARLSPRAPALAWGESGHERRPVSARARARAFDLVVAAAGLVITAPIWMVVALARRRDVLVRQVRVGEGGRPFTMLKLRTMRLDAEPDGRAVWAQPWDPRASLAGRILRATHVDEIPQFWNVLRGEMSIVGPRPERPELTSMLEETIPNWNGRHAVKPGMTGWAQVCLDYVGDRDRSEQKLSYDLWYVRNGNVLVDLAIVLWTIPRTLGDCARAFVARRRAGQDETPAHAIEPAAPAVQAPIRSAGSAA
jgi:lipopolysaccharide/colanic/teichoic acid biosynthesis glycosyltransferase